MTIFTNSQKRQIYAISRNLLITLAVFLMTSAGLQAATINVSTPSQLVNAVNNGAAGDTVNVAAGTYEVTATLKPKANMTIRGAGAGNTLLRNAASWDPGTTGLPDNATDSGSVVRTAYLFDFSNNNGITLSEMTLDGSKKLHGAIFGNYAQSMTLHDLIIKNYRWSGIRTWAMQNSDIYNNHFIDAGGWQGGTTGGMIYGTWTNTTAFFDNTFSKTASQGSVYGIKGREFRNSRIAYNTILLGHFSIELPHENDYWVEIDHNYMDGPISIPKGGGGGTVPADGYTFWIHHNYMTNGYSIESARSGVIIEHNLFDFDVSKDGSNLISNWTPSVVGPMVMRNNLIKNPGRGIYWSDQVYYNFTFENNHVITNTTVTPRTEGLFGFPSSSDFSTLTIRNNIIECNGVSRPLVRNSASYATNISNNTLTNVSDSGNYTNPNTGAARGITTPLFFKVGAFEAYQVDGWDFYAISGPSGPTEIGEGGNIALGGDGGSYGSGQDGSGALPASLAVSGDGSSATLSGNAWKLFPLTYTVTADTVLEITVEASDAGEILGVSLDNDTNPTSGRRAFLFGGSQVDGSAHSAWSWTLSPLYTGGEGAVTYVIPVGDFFTGPVAHLGLIADDDADGSTNVTYSNLKLYEAGSDGLITLAANADSYVVAGSSSTNYGNETTLLVKDTSTASTRRRSFIKFHLDSLADDTSSAQLVLTVQGIGGESVTNRPVHLVAVSDDSWTEGGITWSNQPALGETLATFTITAADVGNEIAIDVTDYVNAQRSDGVAGFALVQPDGSNALVKFHSREGAAPPKIEVTTDAQSLAVTADSHVVQGSSSTNYGSDDLLLVKHSSNSSYHRRAFFKVPVGSLGTDVSAAELVLTVQGIGGENVTNRPVRLVAVSDDSWTENGITWSNQPALGETLATFTITAADVGNEIAIDMTDYVNAQRADGVAGFALVQPDGGNALVRFYSREGIAPPKIEVTP
ncbi:MAG: DNRLRE domain-containing protein [Opitutales bacterium]